jgi:hypothetical protein
MGGVLSCNALLPVWHTQVSPEGARRHGREEPGRWERVWAAKAAKVASSQHWDRRQRGPSLAARVQEYYLGTGSVFGLLSALVGEGLPGAGPCLAVGNALRQGPVVYEFPQPLVASIQQGARDGDPTLVQLQLDLFRCAAPAPDLCTRARVLQIVSVPAWPCSAWGREARSEKGALSEMEQRSS